MSYEIDADGTVHLGTHRVPVPHSISAEARAYLATDPWAAAPMPDEPVPMWAMREAMAPAFAALNTQAAALYPVHIEAVTLGGVPCHRIRCADAGRARTDGVLMNLHGGGFVVGAGALVEAIPLASLTGFDVIAVDYRLAPEHPYPAAVDDVLAVYRACLAGHDANAIGLYGSSAGGFLTAQAIARMPSEGLPTPACAGVFSAGGTLAELGDTRNLFTLSGFYGQHSLPADHALSEIRAYLGGADAADPRVSPELGDLAHYPPTLVMSGTRDALLSAATNFHRALLRAGRPAELIVYDAMPHSHWYALHLPETREALGFMADFFSRHVAVT